MTKITDASATGPALPFRPFRGVRIDLPTNPEIMSFTDEVFDTGSKGAVLPAWKLMALHYEIGGGDFELVAVGKTPDGEGLLVTAPIATVDLERRLVRTKLGIVYALDDETGSVSSDYVSAVKSALVGWGWEDERAAA